MSKHHVVITGTGRAGTTFLVQLYTALGLPTGFSNPFENFYANCSAGMEWDIRRPDAPYIVKNPDLCDYLDALLEQGDIVIDHALIPVRNLYSAAESRRDVNRRTFPHSSATVIGVPGGLWHVVTPEHQELVLTLQLYKVMFALTKHNVPTTLLHFPRFINDPEYLYSKLAATLTGIDYERFLEAFKMVVHPEWVHQFEPPRTLAAAGKS
jgi:hypothetical protein